MATQPLELELRRFSETDNDTIGWLFDEHKLHLCNTMEDEGREIKVPHETRIPAGRYKLGIQETITPMTQRYLNDTRLKPWFKKHIEVKNVPGFIGIYIHIGNTEKDTDGCILLGIWRDSSVRKIEQSVINYRNFYLRYYPLLAAGVEIYLTITDPVKNEHSS